MKEFDPKLIETLRKSMPSMIAEQLVSVQPMPDNIDWNELERAYGNLANHLEANDIQPLLRVRKSDET